MNFNILAYAVFLAVINLASLFLDCFALEQTYRNLFFLSNVVLCLALAIALYRYRKRMLRDGAQFLSQANTEKDKQMGLKLVQLMPNFLCLKDADGRWLLASPGYLRHFNLQRVDYKGKTNEELGRCAGADVQALMQADVQDKNAWQSRQPLKERQMFKGAVMEITRIPVFDAALCKTNLLLFGDPVNDGFQEVVSNTLKMGELTGVSKVYGDSHFGWALLNEDCRIVEANPLFCDLFGYGLEETVGKQIASFVVSEFPFDPLTAFAKNHDVWSREMICWHKQGAYRSIKLNISQMDKNNKSLGYFVSAFDITKQKQAENRVKQIAHYDDLTGLVNRGLFFSRLSRFLANDEDSTKFVVVFFIDLDRFKAVNDSLGHDVGDQLLKEAATRLLAVARKNDVVARLGGDEFGMLLADEVSHGHAVYSASMLAEKIVQTLSEPFYIQRSEIFVGASVGISVYPEDAKTPEELIKLADISMYEAKKQGRNNYQFYKKSYTDAWLDRLAVEQELRKAIEKKELALYFQPQYSAANSRLHGAEVLVRWRQGPIDKPKIIPPDKFISIAEETGLIVELGQWILEQACQQMKAWQVQGLLLERISVNVSPRQFSDNRFLQSVEDALQKAELNPRYLELELTESMLIGNIKQIELQLQRLKKMGISLVLDDFGTGYSSLSYLRNFPIDVVKIDKSFIEGTPENTKNVRIVCAIINMGHSLAQKVVAEGVETEEQLTFLKKRGCDIIQGYYFSKPLPIYKMAELLADELKLVKKTVQ